MATDQAAQVTNALRESFFYAAQVRRPAPLPNPSEVAWEALRSAIRAQGISTIGLAKVSSLAIDNCMAPSDLTLDWTSKAAAQMDTPKRTAFAIQLRKLDNLLGTPDLATMLYAEPISALPDLRKHGKIEPPADIIAAVDDITATHRRAKSTCNEARAAVRKIWTAAAKDMTDVKINTLDELLDSANKLHLDNRTYRIAARLVADLHSMREAA